jgi:hypothetical protein
VSESNSNDRFNQWAQSSALRVLGGFITTVLVPVLLAGLGYLWVDLTNSIKEMRTTLNAFTTTGAVLEIRVKNLEGESLLNAETRTKVLGMQYRIERLEDLRAVAPPTRGGR